MLIILAVECSSQAARHNVYFYNSPSYCEMGAKCILKCQPADKDGEDKLKAAG